MTPPIVDLDSIRNQAIVSSRAGFPFLLVLSFAWIAAGLLSYVLPREVAAWMYPLAGIPAVGGAIALERRIGYIPPPKPDPLLPLGLQIMFVQMVAFPAVALVWSFSPSLLPVAFAAIVGGHFLPFQWLYRTRLYGVLGIIVAGGPYVLAAMAGERALHYTGFFVGSALLIGAFFARSHAAAVWRQYQETIQPAHAPQAELSSASDG